MITCKVTKTGPNVDWDNNRPDILLEMPLRSATRYRGEMFKSKEYIVLCDDGVWLSVPENGVLEICLNPL